MAVEYLGELEEEQRSEDNAGIITYTHLHYLDTARSDTAYDIWTDVNTPQLGAVHPDDPLAYVRRRGVDEVRRFKDPSGTIKLRWRIRIDYSNEFERATNPLLEPANIEVRANQFSVPAERNRSGHVITNRANTPVKGLQKEQTRVILLIEKNVADSALSLLDGFEDIVNADTVVIGGYNYTENTARLKPLSLSKTRNRNGVNYRVFKFEIHSRPDEWKVYYPNEGLYQRTTGGPANEAGLFPTFDSTGSPSTVPQPLDALGEQTVTTSQAALLTLEEHVYAETLFAALSSLWT